MRITGKVIALRIVGLASALLGTAVFSTSCQEILGEVEVVGEGSGTLQPEDAGSGGVTVAECQIGEFQCLGAIRQVCAQMAPGEGPTWINQEDCTTAALCELGLEQAPIRCAPPACDIDEPRCTGATPEQCNSDLTGFVGFEYQCASAAQCSTNIAECPTGTPCCTAEACTPGQMRCNQGELQRCRDDRQDWDTVEVCASTELCQQGLEVDTCDPLTGAGCQCAAAACVAGATRCTGTTLERCNIGQTGWDFVDTCASEALCALSLDSVPLACEPPRCSSETDEHRCTEDGVLQRCRDDRTGFIDLEACPGGAAFCNAVDRRCDATPCGPGDTRCNGAVIEVCRENRSGFDPTPFVCATADLCSNVPNPHCDPPQCAAEAFICNGNQLQRCNDGRTGFVNVGAPCLRADLCSAERRRCDFCFPSRRECTPDQTRSRTCNAAGTQFGPETFCPLGCIPETGACRTCTIGSYRCANGNLERCNDGRSFTPLNRNASCEGSSRVSCTNGVVQTTPCEDGCNAQRFACNECSGQERRCSGAGSFQQCTPNGTFGPSQGCGGGLACEGAGLCRCAAGSRQCDGANLLVCSPDRTGFVLSDVCENAAECNASTSSTCVECVQGECIDGQPFSCNLGELVPNSPCANGFECVGAGLCRCDPGELVCQGNALTSCNGGGTQLTPATACVGGTLRQCFGGNVVQTPCVSGQCTPGGAACLGECNNFTNAGCDDDEQCVNNTCVPVPPPPPPEEEPEL